MRNKNKFFCIFSLTYILVCDRVFGRRFGYGNKQGIYKMNERTIGGLKLNQIYNENCLDTMNKMSDNFIDLTVTSPPY